MSEQVENNGGMKIFGAIWIGQLISALGSGLTGFALSIWVLQRTHSVTQFTLVIVLTGLPGILVGPFAGALVDRWDRRWVLFWCNLVPAVAVASLAYMLWTNQLQIWHIYVVTVVNAITGTFQWPAYISAITMLVDRKHFGRVNGMLEFGGAGTTIAAPFLAGLLLVVFKIWDVLLIDFVTFLFAAVTLLFVKIPRPPESAESRAAKGSIWKEAAYGWTYIRARPGLFNLLLFFAATNLVGAVCGVAVLPMVLGFSTQAGVGTIMSLVGVGMLIGGAIMTATGGPKPRVYGVLGQGLLMTVCFVLIGIRPSLPLVGLGVLLWYVGLPIMNSSSQAIWQSKVAPDLQGRVFAVRRMIAQFTVPIGDFSAGPLADKVFNPMLLPGGALAATAGKVIGVGPGRGIAFMFMVGAILPAICAVVGFLNPRLRNVESELPDFVRQPPPQPEEEPATGAAATGEAAAEA
jgi:DHA3 family macrolide efflux protein-like MFS transporter